MKIKVKGFLRLNEFKMLIEMKENKFYFATNYRAIKVSMY